MVYATPEWASPTYRCQMVGTIHVGLIDSNEHGPFDRSNQNRPEKDIENKIWAEDKSACEAQHITLAVATTLSRSLNGAPVCSTGVLA